MTDRDGPAAPPDDRRCHVDGDLVPESRAMAVRDRGFRYGDAAVETLRAYGGAPSEWAAHADRLRAACRALGIGHGLADAELRERVLATLSANGLDDALVRLSITRGPEARPPELADGWEPSGGDPTVAVTVTPTPRGGVDGDPPWDGPAALQTVKRRPAPAAAIPAGGATHSRLDRVLARRELRAGGGDEALVRDADGDVVSGAFSDVFFVGDGLRVPAAEGVVPPAPIRSVVRDLAAAEDLPVEAGEFPPAAVRGADEAFLASAAWGIRPVGTVDGIVLDSGDAPAAAPAGAGPVTALLARLFDRRIEREHYRS